MPKKSSKMVENEPRDDVEDDEIIEDWAWPTKPDQDLHERNIEFLTRTFPSCRELIGYGPGTELTFMDNGECNVALGEDALYGDEGALTYIQRQYKQYWDRPHIISMRPSDGSKLDEYTFPFTQRLLKGFVEEDITIFKNPASRRADNLVIFGIGLAPHLEVLLEDTQCHSLLLVEPNLEFIYQSTFVFDWERFYKKAKRQNCTISILPTPNVGQVVGTMRDILVNGNVMTFDGTLLYTHYANQFFAAAQKKLSMEIPSYLMALGYTEDEHFMTRNTYKNFLSREIKLFQATAKLDQDVPIFIFGGGPSKDQYLDMVRANQHKAIILSCGSALNTLMAEGITPDFQFIIERGEAWCNAVKKTAEQWDLSPICFVGSTTVHPGLQDLFGRSVLFYRPSLSPTLMFGKTSQAVMEGCDPQVGNAGLAFALFSGVRKIYMFGFDLGSRDPALHHSKNSLPMEGFFLHHEFDKKMPGSLGGTIYTCNQLLIVRENFERTIARMGKKKEIYNCGDGLRIKGMIPKLAHKLSLPELPREKSVIVSEFLEKFKTQTPDDFLKRWREYDLLKQADQFHEDVLAIFHENPDYFTDELFRKLDRYLKSYESVAQANPTALYKGNIYMMMMTAWYYLLRISGDENLDKAMKIVTASFEEALQHMVSHTRQLVDHLENGAPDRLEGGETAES